VSSQGARLVNLSQFDILKHGILGSAGLVLDEACASRAAELPKLHSIVNEPLRLADQCIRRLDWLIDPMAVKFVVRPSRRQRLCTP
jgi:hypothetical protein